MMKRPAALKSAALKTAPITQAELQHYPAPRAVREDIPAGPPAGLYCTVYPSGGRSYVFRYRFEGAPRKLTLGSFGQITLDRARAAALAALDKLAAGHDPAGKRGAPPPLPPKGQQGTFAAVAAEFVERHLKAHGRKSWRQIESMIAREALPLWKDRPLRSIETEDILKLLDSIMDRGAPTQANRVRAHLSSLFNWALSRRYIKASPIAGTRPPAKEVSRDRVLTDEELAAVLRAAEKRGYPYGPHHLLLALTLQRENEVAQMQWSDLDLAAGVWTIAKENNKGKRVHDVPLAPQAVEILRAVPRFTAGDYVFSTTSGRKPINGFSKAKEILDGVILGLHGRPLDPWRFHDLRRTGATGCAPHCDPHVLSAILNHAPARLQHVTAVYNRYAYMKERRATLEIWAAHVTSLLPVKSNALPAAPRVLRFAKA